MNTAFSVISARFFRTSSLSSSTQRLSPHLFSSPVTFCTRSSGPWPQPERIQGAPYTIKSDIWSLGISLIELALGRFPFSDNPNDEEGEDPEPEYDPDPTLPLNANRPNLTITGRKKPHLPPAATHNLSILDLLQHIVNEPAPKLISSKRSYPEEAKRFVEGCLDKDPRGRTSPGDLLVSWFVICFQSLRCSRVGLPVNTHCER